MLTGDFPGGRAGRAAGGGTPFVGRERELAQLRHALAEAESKRGSAVVLAGETGIGKTRTVREFCRWAEGQGACVLAGGCYEGWSPPYGVFTEALARHVRSVSRKTLLTQAGSDASVLTALMPELRPALRDLPSPPALPPDEARFRAHEALAGFLRRISERTLVVLLDDLQWADSATLEFLSHLGRVLAESRMLVVGTYREPEVGLAHPLSQTLAELDRQGACVRLRLKELERDESAKLIERIAGTAAPPELLDAILARTGGNPFFLGEVILHLLEEGHELGDEELEMPGIPESVRQAVGQRLGRLETGTASVLGVACAFSRPFDFSVLGDLTDLSEDRLLTCLDEALAARFLREAEGGRYDFAHSLVRDSLYGELTSSRRARLHRRIALALESTNLERGEHATELATQYYLSRFLPGADHGITHALAAAEQAGAASASGQRVEFLRMARDLAVDSDRALQAEILRQLALAEAEALFVDEAVSTAREELELGEDDRGRNAEFLAELVWRLKDAGSPQEILAPLVQAGRDFAGGRRDLIWARLELSEYPVEIVARDPVPVGRWCGYHREAVRLARETGTEFDYARTLEVMEWTPRDDVEALLERVRGWTEPWAQIHGLSVLARMLLLQHGLLTSATETAGELLTVSEAAGSLPGYAYAEAYLLVHEPLVRGDFATAGETFERGLAVVDRLGPGHRLRFSARFVEALFAQYIGGERWADHARSLVRNAETARVPAWMALLHMSLACYLRSLSGDSDGAALLLDPIVALSERLGPRTLNQNGVVAFAGGACWELEDGHAAVRLRRLALALQDGDVGDYPTCSTELTIARMAALCGDDEGAAEYFARARTKLDESERQPLRAFADYDEARAHARRGKRRAAEPLVTSARARFEQLGMPDWTARASALTDSLGRLSAFPDGLTAREVEILRLVAAGRKNQEIASELVVSVHTVERHLANIYRKIPVRNRAEATTYTLRAGL
jgi:DNA-binding CsgD family transcriptional regulator